MQRVNRVFSRPVQRPHPPGVVELDGPFSHRMLHTRGIRLHAAEAGSPEDPLVLCIHGSFGAWCDFKDALGPLANQGLHAVAIDLRGFGMSDKPPSRAGDLTHILAGDIAGAIRSLGHTRAVLVGSDTGAVVARAAAEHYPDLVTAVFCLPASRGYPAAISRLAAPLLKRHPRTLDRVWRANLAADTTDEFHSDRRFDEFLQLRTAARRIDHALPSIVATSRLRPVRPQRLRTQRTPRSLMLDNATLATSRLPHVEWPQAFAANVGKQVRTLP